MTVAYEDLIKEFVKFKHSLKNIDNNDYLQLSETYVPTNRDLSIILQINYHREIIILKFIDSMDVVSKLGGYKSAFEPIFMYFFPIIILHFLINYSNVIRSIYIDKYKSELERTLRAC